MISDNNNSTIHAQKTQTEMKKDDIVNSYKVIIRAGSTYPSRAPGFTSSFWRGPCCSWFCVVLQFCLSLFCILCAQCYQCLLIAPSALSYVYFQRAPVEVQLSESFQTIISSLSFVISTFNCNTIKLVCYSQIWFFSLFFLNGIKCKIKIQKYVLTITV